MLLEDDVTYADFVVVLVQSPNSDPCYRWKGAVVQKLQTLEDSIARIATKVNMPELQLQTQGQQLRTSNPPVPVGSQSPKPTPASSSIEDENRPPPRWTIEMDPRGGPASIPASCVSEIRQTASMNAIPSSNKPDLISAGVLSLRQALSLFDTYHSRLDHFLYRILGDHTALDSIRTSSPLLTTAICTVGALHSSSLGYLFDSCYREYKNLVAALTFSTNVNADDVRGLCIGAFWLHELSWSLIGTG